MIKWVNSFIFFTFWYCATFTLNAQNENTPLRFRHLGIEDGLSSSSVYNIMQDNKGFIWIATDNGLNRYDGNNFKTFVNSSNDSASISSNAVVCMNCMVQDNEGNIWIGHRGGGIDVLNPSTEKFTHYFKNPDDSTTLSHNDVRAIIKDEEGNIWIGTGSGLNYFDYKTKKFIRYYCNLPNRHVDADNIWALHPDKKGKVWIGTFRGGGLLVFDKIKKKYEKNYSNIDKDTLSLSQNYIVSITEDKNSKLWIGTRDFGLNCFDRNSQKFTRYMHHPENPLSLSGNDLWSHSMVDRDGKVWIGTRNEGINIFNRENNSFIHVKNNSDIPSSISSNEIRFIFEDESGLIWIGSKKGGIDIYDKKKEQFEVYQPMPNVEGSLGGKKVTGICEDRYGDIWVSMYSTGVDRWDKKLKKFIHYRHNPKEKFSLSLNTVTGISKDGKGTLWTCGFGAQLDTFDYKKNNFRIGLAGGWLQGLFSDSKGTLWILGNDPGIATYNPNEKKHTFYPASRKDSTKLGPGLVNSIAEDKNGIIWLGTGSGLYAFNRGTGLFSRYKKNPSDSLNSLSANIVEALYHNDGVLWMITNEGLDSYTVDEKKFKHHSVNFLSVSILIKSLAMDAQKNLWIATNKGLIKFNPGNGQFKVYDTSDGLPTNDFESKDFSSAFYKAKDGKFYYGTVNGILAFYPEKIKNNLHIPKVVITGFSVLNQTYPLLEEISYVQEITLNYKQYFFSIDFAALDFSAVQKNQYAYKLEGFNKDWVNNGNNHSVTFTNLDAGEYILKVKASNNHGIWNEEGTQLKIIITPPFWKTKWFYTLCVIGSIVFIYIFIKWRTSKLTRDKKMLELKVKARTAEIVKQKDIIEDKQKEILDSIRYAKRIQNALITSEKYIEKNLNKLLGKKFK